MLSYKEAVRLFKYKPNGTIFWRIKRSNACKKGFLGSLSGKGYLRLKVGGRSYNVHHIVWLLHHKKLPKNQLHHKDGNKINNRISNLEEVSNRKNCQNKTQHLDGKLPGCYYDKTISSSKKWKAQIFISGKTYHIGRFHTEKQAHNAYLNYIEEKLGRT